MTVEPLGEDAKGPRARRPIDLGALAGPEGRSKRYTRRGRDVHMKTVLPGILLLLAAGFVAGQLAPQIGPGRARPAQSDGEGAPLAPTA